MFISPLCKYYHRGANVVCLGIGWLMKLSKGWTIFVFKFHIKFCIDKFLEVFEAHGKKVNHKTCIPPMRSLSWNLILHWVWEQNRRRQAVTWKMQTKFHLIKSIKRLPSLHICCAFDEMKLAIWRGGKKPQNFTQTFYSQKWWNWFLWLLSYFFHIIDFVRNQFPE